MQRLKWHCHTKSVSGVLYTAILYHGQSAGKEMANSAVYMYMMKRGLTCMFLRCAHIAVQCIT